MFLAALSSPANPEVSPDATQVYRPLQEDVSAIEQLYDRHMRTVYGLVLRILQQADTAEEVVKNVFLQLWRRAGLYDESRRPFVPWLLTLARNRALDTLHLKSERQRLSEEQTEELPPVSSAPPEYDKEARRTAPRRKSSHPGELLESQAEESYRAGLFEGLSHSEIAATLKAPLGTVKSWICNGLLRLKEGLQATS